MGSPAAPGQASGGLSRRWLLGAAAGSLVAGPAAGQTAPEAPPQTALQADSQAASQALVQPSRWTFTGWDGPPVGMWTYRPAAAGPRAPVVMVCHGVNRDADRYFAEWAGLAQARGFCLIAPEFDRAGFPGADGYNQGGIYPQGSRAAVRPRALWTFSVLDRLFEAWRRREGGRTARYQLFGHSAGSQFVHRAVLASPPRRADRIVAANAGFYTFPTLERPWPFGLKDSPFGEADLRRWLAQPMTVLLGTADNDPQHRSLNRDPPALEQGPHRLARGEAFFEAGRAEAARRGWTFAWTRSYAPGIDHNNARMAPFAADILLAPA
jgi:alpha-beta hydrolase superfamily lysophospholipase